MNKFVCSVLALSLGFQSTIVLAQSSKEEMTLDRALDYIVNHSNEADYNLGESYLVDVADGKIKLTKDDKIKLLLKVENMRGDLDAKVSQEERHKTEQFHRSMGVIFRNSSLVGLAISLEMACINLSRATAGGFTQKADWSTFSKGDVGGGIMWASLIFTVVMGLVSAKYYRTAELDASDAKRMREAIKDLDLIIPALKADVETSQ